MRYHKNGAPGCGPHTHKLFLNDTARQCVDLSEGLIEKEHFGLYSERARQTDPLPHTAGEESGFLFFSSLESHHVNVFLGMLTHLGLFPRRIGRFDGQANIAKSRQPRHQGKTLKHNHAVQARLIDLSTFKDNPAFRTLVEAGDDVQKCTFSTSRVADRRDKFASCYPEIYVFENTKRFAVARRRSAVRNGEMFRNMVNGQIIHFAL